MDLGILVVHPLLGGCQQPLFAPPIGTFVVRGPLPDCLLRHPVVRVVSYELIC